MSVALLDHGEMVPGRGTTSRHSPASPVRRRRQARPVGEKLRQHALLLGAEWLRQLGEMHEARVEPEDRGVESRQAVEQLREAECGQRRRAGYLQHGA